MTKGFNQGPFQDMDRTKGDQKEIVKQIKASRVNVPLLSSSKEQEDGIFPRPGGRMVAAAME